MAYISDYIERKYPHITSGIVLADYLGRTLYTCTKCQGYIKVNHDLSEEVENLKGWILLHAHEDITPDLNKIMSQIDTLESMLAGRMISTESAEIIQTRLESILLVLESGVVGLTAGE
jgi:hypothetical protein